MTKRGYIVFLILIFLSLAIIVITFSYYFFIHNYYESSKLIVKWHKTDNPMVISGKVVDMHKSPVEGLCINVVDSSGGDLVTTDKNGNFSTKLSEGDLDWIEIYDVEKIHFYNPFIGFKVREGIHFDIQVKSKMDELSNRRTCAP